MEGGTESELGVEIFEKSFRGLESELGISVGNHWFRKSMKSKYVFDEEFRSFDSIDCRVGGDQMSHLGEVADNNEDIVIAFALRQLGNEVQRNNFPWSIRNRHELQWSSCSLVIRLAHFTTMTSPYVLDDISLHLGPE